MLQPQQKVLKANGGSTHGFSIARFSREIGWTHRRTTKAVDAGEIASVTFGGVREIPPGELPRVRKAYGLEQPVEK
jgi:hypothetical protein